MRSNLDRTPILQLAGVLLTPQVPSAAWIRNTGFRPGLASLIVCHHPTQRTELSQVRVFCSL